MHGGIKGILCREKRMASVFKGRLPGEGKAWTAFRERGFLSATLAGQGLGFQEGSKNKVLVYTVREELRSLLPDTCQ